MVAYWADHPTSKVQILPTQMSLHVVASVLNVGIILQLKTMTRPGQIDELIRGDTL